MVNIKIKKVDPLLKNGNKYLFTIDTNFQLIPTPPLSIWEGDLSRLINSDSFFPCDHWICQSNLGKAEHDKYFDLYCWNLSKLTSLLPSGYPKTKQSVLCNGIIFFPGFSSIF
jgi:hypothetical protein